MKNRNLILFSTLSCFFMFVLILLSCNQYPIQKNVVTIHDYRDQKQPVVDLESHQSGDVVIYLSSFFSKSYGVTIYHNFNGELESHSAFYAPTEDFDKASYYWKDDTTVSITLIDTKSKKELHFEVCGNKNATGMRTED